MKELLKQSSNRWMMIVIAFAIIPLTMSVGVFVCVITKIWLTFPENPENLWLIIIATLGMILYMGLFALPSLVIVIMYIRLLRSEYELLKEVK